MARDRTNTDAMSGMNLNAAEFSDYTGQEVEGHFSMFKEFDLDDSGFISPDNLMSIMEALEVAVSQEVVTGMITEVSILCGHDDDGKLSFRDYMSCMSYEKIKNEHNKVAEEALEAAEECLERGITDPQVRTRTISVEDEGGPPAFSAEPEAATAEEEEFAPTERMRGTSFAVMHNVAKSRMQTFQGEASQDEIKKTQTAQNVVDRIQKFKRFEAAAAPPGQLKLKSENMELATLKNKLAAFEMAKRDADKAGNVATIKKSWKKVGGQAVGGGSCHKSKRSIVGPNGEVGPPPPKQMADLLK
uniref:EF-hand domain-containing protein n=1 Tax=Phaeocystis antarctica TaxID=33657 RepID=A0A7S0E816_9EUKA